MTLEGAGVLITAVSGAVFGGAALWRSFRQDKRKADVSAVTGYVKLVDDMRKEIGHFQRETAELRGELSACSREKEHLQTQINDLYRELGRQEGHERGANQDG